MATWMAETCWWALRHEITFLYPSGSVGVFKKKYTKLHVVPVKQKCHGSVPINVKDRSATWRTWTVWKMYNCHTENEKATKILNIHKVTKFFTVQDIFQVTEIKQKKKQIWCKENLRRPVQGLYSRVRNLYLKWRKSETKWRKSETRWRKSETRWRKSETKWRKSETRWRKSETDENLKQSDENLKQNDEILKQSDENLKQSGENLKQGDENLKQSDENLVCPVRKLYWKSLYKNFLHSFNSLKCALHPQNSSGIAN